MSNNNNENPPQLVDVLAAFKKDLTKSINCVQIGTIESFNESNQTASINLSIKQIKEINPDGSKTIKEYPLLVECPVFVLSGGSAYLSMPISQGDTCIVLFNDRDTDNWFEGASGDYPNTYRTHDLSDGLALVGIRNLNNVITDYLNDQITLKLNDANKIEVKDGSIETTSALLKQVGKLEVDGDIEATGDVDAVNVAATSAINGTTVASTGAMTAGNGASGIVATASPTGSITFLNGIATVVIP